MQKIAGLLILIMAMNCALFNRKPKENREIDGVIYLAEEEPGVKEKKARAAKSTSETDNKSKKIEIPPEELRDFKKAEGITFLSEEDQAKEAPNQSFKPSQGIETGRASYYALELKGSRTASGEIYDPTKLTAAHPTLPFGTMVRVTNLYNQESVIVRINDRGPRVRSRIIDLSYAAAEKLGFIKQGITQVSVEVVKDR
ncbi:MAG: septal ring lytic transglycosylase RlpA family protein [candidate division KSB1 bacterium]|nr:septal ring lytic transglycosylase RlpA family protein [candidate division KSB1 bacterium]MDZ7318607.1 septal ring lytic transglycosylase RlpA family protein [candidate division KSB1 bacterium]MDZ7339901.1 septal ring lytic transglycosylase RlpA family protein [candidate division KSB1 bacterium]